MKKNTIIGDLMAKISTLILRRAAASSLSGSREAKESDFVVRLDRWTRDKGWLEDQSMDDVAKLLGVRKEQLSLYFHTYIGKSFIQWRRELRIEEAMRRLLEDKTIPTALIGESVGINDKSNFRRQFKELTGYTPAEWRRLKH